MRAMLSEMYALVEEEKKTMSEETMKQPGDEEAAISEWQLHTWSVNLFRQQVQGTWTRQRLLQCLPRLRRHLGERRRKRPHRWQQAYRWLVDPGRREGCEVGDGGRNVVSARCTTLA